MSTETPNPETPEPAGSPTAVTPPVGDGTPSRYRSRSGRTKSSGTAVVARGESMVWLSAGSLAICVVMIVGLLVLIVARGATTFWPTPVVRVELADGTVHLGELSKTETYELVPSMLSDMPEPIAELAEQRLAAAADATAADPAGEKVLESRRMLRTGNNELTRKHFDWIDEFAVVDESQPEWAVVLERLEYGRFYGTPLRFESRTVRPPSGEEKRLVKVLNFFSPVNLELVDEANRPAVEAELAKLRDRLDETRRKGILDFRRERTRDEGGELIAEVEGTGDMPFADYDGTGNLLAVRRVWTGAETAWERFREVHPEALERYEERRHIEEHDVGRVNRLEESARLVVRGAEIDSRTSLLAPVVRISALDTEIGGYEKAIGENAAVAARVRELLSDESPLAVAAERIAETVNADFDATLESLRESRAKVVAIVDEAPPAAREAVDGYFEIRADAEAASRELRTRIDEIKADNERHVLFVGTASGEEVPILVRDIVRGYATNQLDTAGKWSVYLARWGEFLFSDPRFANQEGGVFPAIWGTLAMTVIMSLAVVPFGVLAALYLREYAKAGFVVSAVRIAVNNLAGVPSIVFGVFGLGFFCYIIGAYVDGGPTNAGIEPLGSATWYAWLAGLAVLAVGAFLLGIASSSSGPAGGRAPWRRYASRASFVLWIAATIALCVVLLRMPEFYGFFRAKLPNPTFGKGGLLWASLTLALLTLPVVIVATEEALAAVPNSMREGSYACGASKWQSIQRIVLPRALPGITTGTILAMARGAGEVAPLMLVGALKLAPELPIDGVAPFVHLDRSFMHLGFHIFDLGFQSQNSEAAKPMVFTTTLLLIALVGFLNIAAIVLRARLRRKFKGSQF